MRGIVVFLLVLVQIGNLSAQFSNNWIDFSQQYYKITTGADGIYRLSYQDMVDSGIPVSTIDPRKIQVYHRGTEISVFISGQNDGVIDPTDYIEFFGIRNDGTLDKQLYVSDYAQPHNYYNLFSDSTAYFLTWNFKNLNGKRVQQYQFNPGALVAEAAGFREAILVNTQGYISGKNILTANEYIAYSQYDSMEGFGSKNLNITTSNTGDYLINGLNQRVISQSPPALNVLVMGERPGKHEAGVYVGPDLFSLRFLGNVNFTGYNKIEFTQTLNWTDISATGDLYVRVMNSTPDNTTSLINVPLIRLNYAQGFDPSGRSLKLSISPNPVNQSLINISPATSALNVWDITDSGNPIKVGYNLNAGTAKAVIDQTSTSRKVWLQSGFSNIQGKKVIMRDINPSFNDYIVISHPTLLQKLGGKNPILDYAGYRNSLAGGGYDTLVVDIEQLNNQFNFGEVSSMAIYNFVDYISQNTDPKALFLIGKGLSQSYNYFRQPDNPAFATYKNLLPPGGDPASDMLYATRVGSFNEEPRFPVGRIPASTIAEAESYFNKVMEYESLPFDKLWRKDVLHLSGGITATEQTLFFNILERLRGTAEGPRLGGKVNTIRKSVIENTTFLNISDEVNSGKGLITFFGHSSPAATDLEVGYVTDNANGYNNSGKYPVMLVNGCRAGFIYGNSRLFGEDWILAQNRGAIGFIANSSYARSDNLLVFSNLFYGNGYSDSIYVNKNLGDVFRKSLADFRVNNCLGLDRRTYAAMIGQMFLMGDPATFLFGAKKPDFEIVGSSVKLVSLNSQPVTAQSDTFGIHFIVKNYGLAPGTPYKIRVSRYLPDNTQLVYDSLFSSVLYSDTLIFKIPNIATNVNSGENVFSIQIDSNFEFQELNENNNLYAFNWNIPQSGSFNVFPYPFSIVSDTAPTLWFQNTDVQQTNNTFYLQLDTTRFFNSAFLQNYVVNSGFTGSQKVSLLTGVENDSTVYYWRTRVSNSDPTELWAVSSFTYINNGSPGWSQGDFFEMTSGQYAGMYPDTLKESWVYNYASNILQVVTYGSNNASGINELSVKINDIEYNIRNINKACRNNTINFIAFDRETANPYLSFGDISSSQIDLKSCGKSPYLINSFAFSEIETGTRDLQTYLDGVSAGDSVVVFTIGNVNFPSWTAGMKAKMTELGFNSTFITDNGLTTGAPMIGYGAKGGVVGSAKVVIPTTLPLADQQLIYLHKVEGKSIHGRLTSPKIGPALSWGSFFKNLNGLDNPVTDKNNVRIFSQTGTIQTEHLNSALPGINDLSLVDPLLYPVIQLELSTSDSIGNTPVQAKRWTVLYTPSPEGVVWGGPELVTPLQKSEGEPVALTFYFMNLSPYYFPDSLTVNYEVLNQGSGTRSLQQVRILAPLPGDTTAFDLNFITKGFQGKNDLDLTVNPGLTPEQFLGNNQMKLNGFMEVGGDLFNPLIDVSFDGRKILNGDLVSSTPLITINLEDDNAYLPLSDTTFLDFYIAEEGGTYKRVSYSQLGVTWEVKNGGKHLVVNYESGYLNTGSYRLKVVAKDASGNYAGAEPYEIQFEVVNESTITRFYPYPNPFTDKMRFVFTITGDAIPDEFSIRILTITGRVVREIGLSEFGPIYVGNNMSEFYWDGTDQNGDRLGNGVYLYKVTARINGKEVDLNAKHGDRGFKNGIGKIYLAR